MTPAQQAILAELTACGIPWRLSNTGWLLVSGRRTYWREAYWLAFLGWKRGWNPPRIVRTYYAGSES